MDFHSLSRKDLQALCKKNKIPANMTNVAMADALQDLQLVEGLEEILNSAASDCELDNVGLGSVPRTAARTSTRRKPGKEEPGSSKGTITRSRRVTRAVIAEEIEQENNNANSSMTPAVKTYSIRVPAASAPRKMDLESEDDNRDECNSKINNVFCTPGGQSSRRRGSDRTVCKKLVTPNEGKSLQNACSTRRSVRLLEKGIARLSLCHTAQKESTNISEISEDAFDVPKKSNETEEIKKMRSMETESAPFYQSSDEIDVEPMENKTIDEFESKVSDSKLDLGHPDDSEVMESCDGIDVASIENKTSDELESKLSDSMLNLGHPVDSGVADSSDESDIPVNKKEMDVFESKVSDSLLDLGHPVDSGVGESSVESDIPENMIEMDDSNQTEDSYFNIVSLLTLGEAHDVKVDENSKMFCPMICSQSEALPNDPVSSSDKPDSETELEIDELTEESKDDFLTASDNQNGLSETSHDVQIGSKDEVVTFASDNQNLVSEEMSLDVLVGSTNEDLFPRPTFPTSPKKSVGEKQAESKDTAKENTTPNELRDLSMGCLKRMFKNRIALLPVEEKRIALLPVEENRMPVVDVHNKKRDV